MARVDVDWHGEEIEPLIDAAIGRGLRKGLDAISDTSQERVLQHTGELKRSHFTDIDGNRASVGYTDSKAVGAHENLAVTPRKPGTRAKFLESALDEGADDFRRAVADELRDLL